MKTTGHSKKILISFVISALIFSLTALLFTFAFSHGRTQKRTANEGTSEILQGRSFNLLLVMSDYTPDKFNDYDPDSVKNVLGMAVNKPSVSPSSVLSGYRKTTAERMVIVRFDKYLKKIVFIPLSGDTLVTYKGLQLKLCDIAPEWGSKALIEKVHALTGLKIDRFAIFSPQNASKAFDLVGNIDYTVKWNLRQSYPEKGVDISIAAGTSRLDGNMAVDLLRFDRYAGTGTSRADMISGFIKRLISNLSNNFNEHELKELIIAAFNLSYSDFNINTDQDIIDHMLLLKQLNMEYIEPEGNWQTVNNAQYFVPNETKTLKKLSIYRDN